MPEITLCLMLKAPRPGEVKTRLAREVGDVRAAAIYRAIVEHQVRQVPPGWRIEIHFTPRTEGAEMRGWLQPLREGRMEFFPQAEGDLGSRMQAALTAAFDRGAGCVFFAGGDCPGLDSAVLSECAAQMDAAELVLVPALDGGYVLIGMKAAHAGVFDGISWSTAQVLEQTRERARRLALKTALLPALEDVDDLPAWERARERLHIGATFADGGASFRATIRSPTG